MKVIFFSYFFPKISETFTLNRITRLIDSGVDVRIFALKSPALIKAHEDNDLETIVHPDVKKYHLMDRVEYFPKKPDGQLDYDSIEKAIEKHRPDILHIQWGNLGEELLSEIDFNIPVLVTFHSHITPKTWTVKTSGFSNVFTKASLILPVSNYIRNGLIKMGCNPDKLLVHHMGVDTNAFLPALKDSNGLVEITSVGSFIEKKGFHEALEAISLFPNSIKERIIYKIVGDGPMKNEYQKIIKQRNISNSVKFLGKLTQTEIIQNYRNSDIYLHPSVMSSEGDDEGIPTVIMEAQSCGLPVVSTYHTGIPEIVRDGESGFLSQEHDTVDLSQKLVKLINDVGLRKVMGKIGREIVLEEFNVDKLNNQMISIYKKLRQ